MYTLADIRRVHLEITSACNARCPQCPRNIAGGAVNPDLPVTQLRLADVQAIFRPEFVQQLGQIRFCGNYGDPIMAADLLAICAWLRGLNPALRLGLHTNGGARDEHWWQELAGRVDFVRFGIDGLEETNHLYRRGVLWAQVMRSVRAFRGAGGRAEWDFLVFRHNEHEVEAARALAADLGFARFTVKRTRRFLQEGRRASRQEVRSPAGEIEYWLEEPLASEYRNDAVQEAATEWTAADDYAHYLDQTPIACKATALHEIYVSAEALVFPCCYLAHIYSGRGSAELDQVRALLAAQPGGKDTIDARRHPLRAIVEGPFFRAIADSWSADGIGSGRLATCARQCGRIDLFAAQFPRPAHLMV